MDPTSDSSPRSLLHYLAEVPDPRDSNQSHPLSAVLALTTCAMLCGARSLYAAAQWGRDHGGALIQALGFRRAKSPCVATLHNVLKAVDAAAFEAALSRWIAQATPAATTTTTTGGGGRLRGLSIDGKSLRGSQGHQLPGVHLLAVFSTQQGVALAQVRAGQGAGDELPAAQALLAQLELCGLVVTGDALFARAGTLRADHPKKGDYLLAVKGNQGGLQEAIADSFTHAPPAGAQVTQASQTSAHADRVEVRTLRASAALNDYLLSWAGLGQVLCLERRVWQRGRGETIEVALAITSLLPAQASAAELLALWRGHQHIENRLHYVRDVTLGEDACRVRSGSAPQALAALRNAVIGLVRLAGATNVAAALRRYAAHPAEALAAIGINYNPN